MHSLIMKIRKIMIARSFLSSWLTEKRRMRYIYTEGQASSDYADLSSSSSSLFLFASKRTIDNN